MDLGARGAEAERPRSESVAHHGRHPRDILGCRSLIGGAALAHDIGAHRTMRELSAHVDRAFLAGKGIEILSERLPLPVDAGGQSLLRNVFHTDHQIDQVISLAAPDRSKADPAVADNHRGYAVPARRRKIRVPGHLTVVMRVDIDPSGRYQQAVSIDLAAAWSCLAAGRRDDAAVDCDVAVACRSAGAINDFAVPDYAVMHGLVSRSLASLPSRWQACKLPCCLT